MKSSTTNSRSESAFATSKSEDNFSKAKDTANGVNSGSAVKHGSNILDKVSLEIPLGSLGF